LASNFPANRRAYAVIRKGIVGGSARSGSLPVRCSIPVGRFNYVRSSATAGGATTRNFEDDMIVSRKLTEQGKSQPMSTGDLLPGDVPALSDEKATELKEWFQLFADKWRLQIIHLLMHCEELNVRTLCEALGQSQPAVSHHLGALRNKSIVTCRRDGKHNYYSLAPGTLQKFMESVLETSPNQEGRLSFGNLLLRYPRVEEDCS